MKELLSFSVFRMMAVSIAAFCCGNIFGERTDESI